MDVNNKDLTSGFGKTQSDRIETCETRNSKKIMNPRKRSYTSLIKVYDFLFKFSNPGYLNLRGQPTLDSLSDFFNLISFFNFQSDNVFLPLSP